MTRQVLGWPILLVIALTVVAPTVEVPPKGAAGGVNVPPPLLPCLAKRIENAPNRLVSILRGTLENRPFAAAAVGALETLAACAATRESPHLAPDVIDV